MGKKLSEMSLEELWQLFPIFLTEHKVCWKDWYVNECIKKSKEKKGLVILSSKKKLVFLADPKYMKYKGFEVVDSANPYFELMYIPFDKNAEKPYFKESIKNKDIGNGFTLYYTNQCPFTAKYVPIIEEMAKTRNIEFKVIHIQTREAT